MAEKIDSLASEPDNDATSLTPRTRVRRPVARRSQAPAKVARTAPAARPAAPKGPNRVVKPLRSLVILSMVGGLVATVALPAFAAGGLQEESVTIQQKAVADAQTLVVASDATGAELSRDSYSATTSEEIEKKKAEEAAAAAAAERARLAASVASSQAQTQSRVSVDLNMVAPGSGAVRWPLAGYTLGEGFGTRGGAHMGVDMLAAGGTPIFAAAAGVVKVSQESYGGYGVAVTIDHVINGQRVGTLYGHMTYGSRQVVAGQTVQAGQIIGLVGSTGRSTANHLHFETYLNGSNIDPYAWLLANAG
ncbi:M23 family metallopeptidase [Microbacterium sp. CFBP9034]|uniref:M23 family metallopeptidase n=1 Tax=Microbacterium sp. CFBP9034 TaxID=3096540 RepID=UPI002A6A0946|nr:M23 family metallopeptidase [Microbacterium sp. CFBP9034]MDY0910865.1 M23 family metallopeptidase [Microbacterium sp. CFBP9034]